MKKIIIKKFSKIGTYHSNNGVENQDVVLSGNTARFAVITLADGVSSCAKSQTGALIASKAITNLLLKKGDYFLEFEKNKTADLAVSHILYELNQTAGEIGDNTKEYSSTISSILYDKRTKKMLFFNLGDGMILSTANGRCSILSIPADSSEGCPVTTTKNVHLMVNTNVIDASEIDSVLICSDGAWKQMFKKNLMRENVQKMVENGDYNNLQTYLESQDIFDDCSFISMYLKKRRAA